MACTQAGKNSDSLWCVMDKLFKTCTGCGHHWLTRDVLLQDPAIQMVGYQANFEQLELGLFLFNHLECRSTIAVPAGRFRDLYAGPVFSQCLLGEDRCLEYCLRQDELGVCTQPCECAYVREIIQVIRNWPKQHVVSAAGSRIS